MSTQVETMSVQDVANKLVELSREGKQIEAIHELYADDVISIEPDGSPMQRTEGKAAVLNANEHWFDTVEEMHNSSISEPVIGGNFFACSMKFDVTYKGQGRNMMDELAVYGVRDGKIISSQFFYTM